MKLALLILLALGSAGWAGPWQGAPVVTTSEGTRVCAKHHVALVTAAGYRQTLFFCTLGVDPTPMLAQRKVEAYLPNAIPSDQGLLREKVVAAEPTRVTYCPRCETKAARIRRLYPKFIPLALTRPRIALPMVRTNRFSDPSRRW